MPGDQYDDADCVTLARKLLSGRVTGPGEKDFFLSEDQRAAVAKATVRYLKAFTTAETIFRLARGLSEDKVATPVIHSLVNVAFLADFSTRVSARPGRRSIH